LLLILARTMTGRVADRLGRGAALIPGLICGAGAMLLVAGAGSVVLLVAGAAVYALAMGLTQPALLAMTLDRAGALRRGAAMGTLNSASDLGIGGGSFLMGVLAQTFGYSGM